VVKVMRDDLHVLSGSYVLDALSEPERESFERQLQHCPLCEDEVRGLRETAARLGLAKTLDPPPQMRTRVLAAAYRTRQLPPPVGERIGLERRRARVTLLSAKRPRGARRHAQRRPRVPRLAAALAAASLVVVAALGITHTLTRHQSGGAPTASGAISRVVTAPDARTETMRTSVGGTVTVVVSAGQQAAVVSATGMRSLPSAETYQLWVIGPDGARSAGLLSGTGRADPVLASGVVPGDRIGITVEPAGGTSGPTTTPVIAVPV
jgi:anti-sigma-K factor RskA